MKTIQIIMLVFMLFAGAAYAKTINNNNFYNTKKTTLFNNKKSIDSAACTVPAKPALQGSPGVCLNIPADYSITPVPGATSYVWTVVGGHIVSNNYNNTFVTVRWNALAKSISVKAVNACGSSTASKITITTIIPHCGL